MNFNSNNKEEIKLFLLQHIIDKHQARKITGQSETAFNQAVLRGRIRPIIKYSLGKGGLNLFLREEIESYQLNMKKIHKKIN